MKPYTLLVKRFALLLVLLAGACAPRYPSPTPELQATLDAALTQVSAQSTQVSRQEALLHHLATSVLRLPSTPAGRAVPTPFVNGSLSIQGGKCCVGGIASQPLQIQVEFQALSPVAEIADMRVRTGSRAFNAEDFSNSEWEPFTAVREFTLAPPINWTGFYVSVQYRDALGNVSPVYSADISVEGVPVPPASAAP